MAVSLRHAYVLMAQELLNGVEANTALHKPACIGMAQRMKDYFLSGVGDPAIKAQGVYNSAKCLRYTVNLVTGSCLKY